MLPDEMEAEKNRKLLVSQADTIEILKNNVRDLQEQLTAAQIRIKQLTLEKANLIQEKFNLYDDISNLIKEDLECR